MESETKEKVATFFSQYKTRRYKKGELLIQPLDNPEGLFYLEEGVVRQYSISKTGEELVLNTFKAPAYFPMNFVLNESPIRYYFEAVNDVVVWIAPKKESFHFFQTQPDVAFDLLRRIYNGLDGYLLRVENLMTGTARNKLVYYLLTHAKRFGKNNFVLTEHEIAAGAGLSRETVSRQLQILKIEGLVTLEKGILNISDPDKLEKEILSDAV